MPRSTPLASRHTPLETDARSFLAHALASLRASADLPALVRAVDNGEIPPNLEDHLGTPALTLAIEGWWSVNSSARDSQPVDPGLLARFVPGATWDGQGHCLPSEPLAAALLAAGAHPFPGGRLVNLEAAIRSDARATAVSLLRCPQCPDLKRADPGAKLLRAALDKDDLASLAVLLEKGVDPNADNGVTPAWFGARSAPALRAMLAAGANPALRDARGRGAPQAWSQSSNRALGATVVADMGRVLSQAGTGPASADAAGDALMAAVRAGQVGPLKAWIGKLPDPFVVRRPLPGAYEKEDLAEAIFYRLLDTSPLSPERRTNSWERGRSPVPLLRLVLTHPKAPPQHQVAAALLVLVYGQAFAENEVAARKACKALEPVALSVLSRPDAPLDQGWAVLGTVVRRLARVPWPPGQAFGPSAAKPPTSIYRQPQDVAIDRAASLFAALRAHPRAQEFFPAHALEPRCYRLLGSWAHGYEGATPADTNRWVLVESFRNDPPPPIPEAALAWIVANVAARGQAPSAAKAGFTSSAIKTLRKAARQPEWAARIGGLVQSLDARGRWPEWLSECRSQLLEASMEHALEATPIQAPRVRM